MLGWIRRSFTPTTVALAGPASLTAPKPAMSDSARAAAIVGMNAGRFSAAHHNVAGAPKIAIVRKVSPCRPTIEAIWAKVRLAAERHTNVVPWKSGEQEPARPFAHPQSEGEREDPQGTGRPEQPSQRKSECWKNRKSRWQGDNSERQRPGKLIGVDKDSQADTTRARRRNSPGPSTSQPQTPPGGPAQADRLLPKSETPSISQTAKVIGTTISPTSEKGGKASAPIAPETQAIAIGCATPQDSATRSASELKRFVADATLAAAMVTQAALGRG